MSAVRSSFYSLKIATFSNKDKSENTFVKYVCRRLNVYNTTNVENFLQSNNSRSRVLR